jgi:hypothetical protein
VPEHGSCSSVGAVLLWGGLILSILNYLRAGRSAREPVNVGFQSDAELRHGPQDYPRVRRTSEALRNLGHRAASAGTGVRAPSRSFAEKASSIFTASYLRR